MTIDIMKEYIKLSIFFLLVSGLFSFITWEIKDKKYRDLKDKESL